MLGVVVPHYNQFETLFLSVESIRKNHRPMKIVVVDDGSVPSVVCSPPIPDDVTLIGINPNHGVQFARNTGFHYVYRYNCDFVLFSDSDVIWHPGAIDRLVSVLALRPGRRFSYAYCNWNWGGRDYISKSFNGGHLRNTNYISTMSVIRTKDLFNVCGMYPFDESLKRLQDWDLWLTLLNEGCTGIHVPAVLFDTPFSKVGISGSPGYQEAVNKITKKYGLTLR